ncbi:alpha/beta hydrolase [Saccharopolyspora sp. K220]|uniref:alpha/beta hydrolase n=1 Tax=Saccharopolyspora soli TaxID=2926618 RepID=UPI001F590A23|nr:alpha/beta hydrolase [Saccharopolyspora soli]MCI2418914.1 alpha/beta hydrolase [Saccharopolyspora soli]
MRNTTRATGVATILGALLATGQPALASPVPTFEVPAKFAEQRIQWAPCFAGELPPELPPGSERLECGTLAAPMDWHNPNNGGEISIAVSRLPATGGPSDRALFTNPGGPGGAGLAMPLAMLSINRPELPANFDIYGIDVRGTGRSSTVSCGPQRQPNLDVRDRDPANIQALMDLNRQFAADCQQHSGELGRYVTTEQTVADLDLLRQVERREKINWYGVSGGTWLGAYFATYFPRSVDKVVLDSNAEFTGSWQDVFGWQPMAFERRWRADVLPWLAAHDANYHLGTDPAQVQATVDGLRAALKANPLPVPDGPPVDHNALDVLVLQSMYSKSAFPRLGDTLAALREGAGEAAPVLAQARSRTMPMQATDPMDSQTATLFSIRCNDTAFRGTPESVVAQSGIQGWKFPTYGYYSISQPCLYWERPDVSLPTPTGAGVPPVLMLHSEHDPATAFEGAEIAHRQFQGSRLVTVRNEGDHGVYGIGNACVDDVVEGYLIDGRVPEGDLTCEGLPAPEPVQPHGFAPTGRSLLDVLEDLAGVLG